MSSHGKQRAAQKRAEREAERARVAEHIVKRLTQDGSVPLHRALRPTEQYQGMDVAMIRAALTAYDIPNVQREIAQRDAKMRDRQHGILSQRVESNYSKTRNAKTIAAQMDLAEARRIARRGGRVVNGKIVGEIHTTYVGYVAPRDAGYRTREWTAVTGRLPSKNDVQRDLYHDRAFRAVIQDMIIVRYTASGDGVEPTFPLLTQSRMARRLAQQAKMTANEQHKVYLASNLHRMRVARGVQDSLNTVL